MTIINTAGGSGCELRWMMEARLFYKELECLLYTIAAADGQISDEEVH